MSTRVASIVGGVQGDNNGMDLQGELMGALNKRRLTLEKGGLGQGQSFKMDKPEVPPRENTGRVFRAENQPKFQGILKPNK